MIRKLRSRWNHFMLKVATMRRIWKALRRAERFSVRIESNTDLLHPDLAHMTYPNATSFVLVTDGRPRASS